MYRVLDLCDKTITGKLKLQYSTSVALCFLHYKRAFTLHICFVMSVHLSVLFVLCMQ